MATAAVFHPTPKQSFFGWVPRKETHAVVRLTAPVRAPAAYTDFSSSFLSANLLGSPSRRRTVTVSIVTHTILVGVPLLLSLWFTNTLDLRTYTQTLLVAPPAAAAPSPPPKVVAAQPVHPSRRVFTSQGKLILPTAIPKQIAMLKEEPLPPEDNGGVFGGIPGGVTGGVLGGILEGLKAPEAPAVPRPAEPPRAPVLVGGTAQPPRIISQVTPEYPVLASKRAYRGK